MLKHRLFLSVTIIPCALLGLLPTTQAAQPQIMQSAQWLPDSCTAIISVTSVDALIQDFKQGPCYALWQDEAMKPIVEPIKAKIQSNLKEQLDTLWEEWKVNNPPQSIPWPQGRLVFGAEIKVHDFEYTYPADDENEAETVYEKDMDLQFILVAEMGRHTQETSQLLQQLSEISRTSDMIHRHRRVGDTELHWLLSDPDDDPDFDTLCYALQGQRLVLSTSARLAEQTLKNLKRPGRCMAQSKVLQSMAREVHDGNVTLALELDPIRKILLDLTPDKKKYQYQRALDVLGLQALQGMITSLKWPHQGQQVLCTQTLLSTDGPPQGVLALLCPKSDELKQGSQALKPELGTFVQSHLNLGDVYEQVTQMVRQINGTDITFFAQTAMAATGGQQAPVDLKRDLLDHMTSPLTTCTLLDRPFSQPDQARDLLCITLRNSDAVDTTLARIHQTFLSNRNPELQRQMLDHTLYLIPFGAELNTALAVINNELVLGRLNDLEQLIRETRSGERKPLTHDPLFRSVQRYFPSQAGNYSYANFRICGEFAWEMLKQGLQEALIDKQNSKEQEPNDIDLFSANAFLWEISDLVRPAQMPPFAALSKYFGAAVSYGKRTDHGIFSETLYLQVPAQAD